MRHNDARKWLHAVLDLLPVILIPVFMIYSHRHSIEDNSLVINESKVVDFNQQRESFSDVDSTFVVNDNNQTLIINGTTTGRTTFAYAKSGTENNYFDFYVNHKYYIPCEIENNLRIHTVGWEINVNRYNQLVTCSSTILDTILVIETLDIETYDYLSFNCMVYDLTQMFGEGNEPTIEQFDTYFPNSYYSYTENEDVLIENYVISTYNDSDIMSQFFYCLYNSVNKYFNMGNIFGMNNVYSWFEVNIFGGTASPSIFIVWNIVLYEFVMDLLFLLYGLFMWFIDMCKKLMEKPLNSIK